MVYILRNSSGVIEAFIIATLYFSISVLAAVQTIVIDDHDYTRIAYTSLSDWQHDFRAVEDRFYNNTRSYTTVPGASASLSFTGSAVYIQGGHSDNQALRRVTLDGHDMGVFTAYSTIWASPGVFWGKGGLENAPHTVVVTHNDTNTTRFVALDAWIVEVPSLPTGTLASGTPRSLQYSHSMAMVIPITMLLLLPVYGL